MLSDMYTSMCSDAIFVQPHGIRIILTAMQRNVPVHPLNTGPQMELSQVMQQGHVLDRSFSGSLLHCYYYHYL